MLEKLKAALTWPVVALFIAGLVSFTVITIFAPPEVRTALFGAHGLFFTLLAWLVNPPGASGGGGGSPPTPGGS